MNEFSIRDIANIYTKKEKTNYLGEYIPEHLWEEFGKVYLNTFTKGKEKNRDNFKLNIDALIPRISLIQPKEVLEVGCGFGRCIPFVVMNTEWLKKITGIDFSQTMLNDSKRYFNQFKEVDMIVKKTKLIRADAKRLPFKDKSFDLTYTHVCLTHIPPEYIGEVTSEISRVTKNWIIHIERFRFLYEHPNQHRWSHLLPPYYLDKGWQVWDCEMTKEEHDTIIIVLKAVK